MSDRPEGQEENLEMTNGLSVQEKGSDSNSQVAKKTDESISDAASTLYPDAMPVIHDEQEADFAAEDENEDKGERKEREAYDELETSFGSEDDEKYSSRDDAMVTDVSDFDELEFLPQPTPSRSRSGFVPPPPPPTPSSYVSECSEIEVATMSDEEFELDIEHYRRGRSQNVVGLDFS